MLSNLTHRYIPAWGKYLAAFVFVGVFATLANDISITRNATARLYYLADEIPATQVALVLGTSKYARREINRYYSARIEAAAELFHAGRIRSILLSGDGSSRYYDETSTMRQDLIERGVPKDRIMLDYAGVRTLDSVFRAKKVFGLDRVIVVSQQFHCERAIYLADAIGLEATGFCADDAPDTRSLKIRGRETLARVLAFADLNIFDTQPRSLHPGTPRASR